MELLHHQFIFNPFPQANLPASSGWGATVSLYLPNDCDGVQTDGIPLKTRQFQANFVKKYT